MQKNKHRAQDERVEELWQTLDPKGKGKLDLNGLREGLDRMDHPLQNSGSLFQDIMNAVDKDHDGFIRYSEFRTFIEHTEKELWHLFQGIDRDHNGQIDKEELRTACADAGIIIPQSKLDQFFQTVDTNHDGVISFDEWRLFLLFMPAKTPNLRSVMSYYSSTVTLNAEGDVNVSSDTAESIGISNLFHKFSQSLHGGTTVNSRTSHYPASLPVTSESARALHHLKSQHITPAAFPWDPGDESMQLHCSTAEVVGVQHNPDRVHLLTLLTPHPGYFVAGGVAGIISRTATAPLDRLKVYLIAQTDPRKATINAAKSGAPIEAAQHASRPLVEASKALWRLGGIRSLFAGNGLNVVKVMPESAIKFGSYEGSKRALARFEGHDDPAKLHPWSQLAAAGFGGLISQAFIYPLDTLKFRMQNETVAKGLRGNALIIQTAKKMWRQNGMRSFYRGLPMGLVGMFPYSAIDLTTFEYLKRFWTARNALALGCSKESRDAAPGNFVTGAMGACSGAIGATAVYPINLLRTRLQTQGTAIHPRTYTGIVDVTLKTIKGEGIQGLFKGVTPNLLKVMPAVSITYVVYENSKRLLDLP